MNWKRLVVIAASAMALTASCASSASATSLEVGGVVRGQLETLRFSLTKGTTLVMSRTDGSLANTCLEWDIEGDGFNIGSLIFWMDVDTKHFTKCSRSITVHKGGELGIQHSSGTNGTVSSKEAEVTVGSPFGTLNCKTGAGTHLGTLTGVKSGEATLHVNAVLNCGFLVPSATWKATLTTTTPSGLGVVP